MVVIRWQWDKSAIYNKWLETGRGQGLKVSKLYLKFSYQCLWLHHVHNRLIGELSLPKQQATRQRSFMKSIIESVVNVSQWEIKFLLFCRQSKAEKEEQSMAVLSIKWKLLQSWSGILLNTWNLAINSSKTLFRQILTTHRPATMKLDVHIHQDTQEVERLEQDNHNVPEDWQ